MNIIKYLEVILEDQASLYSMIKKLERDMRGQPTNTDMIETDVEEWTRETVRRLEEAENESSDDAS